MDCCVICLSFCDPYSRITTQSLEWNREQIQRVVEKHLWWLYLQTEPEGQRIKWICKSCWQEISSFHNFYLKVERIHKQYQALLLITNNFEGKTIHDVKEKRNEANKPAAITVKSTEDSSCSSSPLASIVENYKKHEIPESEEEGNEYFESYVKNEPINEVYEKDEHNFDIIEVEDPQCNNTNNQRMPDKTNDAKRQDCNYNSSYNAANSDEKQADNESIMRRVSLGKLKRSEIIDFYKEFKYKLKCTICNTIESTFASLCVHYKNRHNMRGFAMCCGVKFTHRHLLVDHLCVHKDPHFFKCNKCHRVYERRKNFKSHLRKNRCTPTYECNQCGKKFLIQKNLVRHKLTHLKPIGKMFNCEKCQTPFESVELLREHEKHIHARVEEVNVISSNIVSGGEEDITSIIKSEPADDIGILQDESIVSEQSNTVKFKRKLEKSTEHRDNREVEEDDNINKVKEKDISVSKTFRSMYTSSASDEFFRKMQYVMECNLCNEILPDFQSLVAHYRVSHNTEGYGMCCGKKFYRRGVLADHLKLHKDPDLFKCQLCNYRFTARGCLERHIELCAKKLKNYKCEKCHTPFESVKLLREHEKHIHAGIEKVKVITPNIVSGGDEDITTIVKFEPADDTGILQDEFIALKQSNTLEFDRNLEKSTEHRDNSEITEDDNSLPSGSDEFFRKMQYIMECNICNIILPDFQSLLTHFRVVHNTEGYGMCCGKKFNRRGVLADHLKLHKDPDLFKCQLCNHRFTARRCLKKHLEICGNKLNNYNCEKCNTPFESVELLKEHENHIHAGIEKVNVFTPNIVSGGDEDITPIVKSEPADDTGILQEEFIALEQSNTLEFEGNLEKSTEHSEITEDDNSLPSGSDEFFRKMQYIMECNLCNIILPDFQSLLTHFRVVHNTEGYGMCCGKKFNRRGVLADHLKLHKNPDLFKCQLCNHRFTARRCLKKHLEICGKKFKNCENSEFEEDDNSNEDEEEETSDCKNFRNMYTYSGSDEFFREMQYIMQCNLCNTISPDYQSLITHYRVAHNIVGYGMCCGRKFYRRGVLADHLKLHKDPNLFKCQLCSKRFNARRGFKEHLDFCAKKFKKYKSNKNC